MVKKLFLMVAVAFATLLSSCSTHLYQSSNSNISKTEVVLSQKNFRVIGEVQGVATTTQILGIGGLSKQSVRSNAIAEMFNNAKLTGAQTIININVKRAFAGIPPF